MDFYSNPYPLRYSSMDLPQSRYLPGRSRQRSGIDLGGKSPQEIFLYGLDLYSFGYWWEAHEAWEHLWLGLDKKSVEANFLQGLIQLAAAFLKIELEQFKPARRLLETAFKRLGQSESPLQFFQALESVPVALCTESLRS